MTCRAIGRIAAGLGFVRGGCMNFGHTPGEPDFTED
jgi:hypothetical protein